MEPKMSKVLENLYVGNLNNSKNAALLRRYGITHIVSLLECPKRELYDKYYLCITAEDEPEQNLSQFFSVVNDFIHCARINNNKVLVHCHAGVSRSVTVTMAYIMSVTKVDVRNALNVIQAERYIANPNPGFMDQLQDFECNRLEAERLRLRRKYASSDLLRRLDKQWCKDALRVHAVLVSTSPHLFERSECEDKTPDFENEADFEDTPQLAEVRNNIRRQNIRRETETDPLARQLERCSSGEDILINVRLYKPAPKKFRDAIGKFVSTIDRVENYNETYDAEMDEKCNLKMKFNKPDADKNMKDH